MKNWCVTIGCALLTLCASAAAAKTVRSVSVSYVKGSAQYLRNAAKYNEEKGPKENAPWKKLTVGIRLGEGDAVRTKKKTRLELSLKDGSKLRVGSESLLALSKAHFSKGSTRKVGISMWVGRLWAKVAKRVGGESAFEVETQNAVAGVRGTSFTVIANSDLSSLVRVYSGSVGVKKPVRKGKSNWWKTRSRVQVPGPKRVDLKQWEEIIVSQMKQIQVSSLGEIAPAEDFEDSGDELEWAMWNKERDKKAYE